MRSGARRMKDIFEKIIAYLPSYLLALAAAFSGPKTFIGKRQLDTETEWVNALTFLGISTVLVSFGDLALNANAEDLWKLVVSKLILVLLMVAFGAVSVRFSWWLVGGKAPTRSFFIIYAYIAGVLLIIISVANLLALGVLKQLDPTTFAKIAARQSIKEGVDQTALAISLTIGVAGFLTAEIWGLIAWGAYRILTGNGKFRSAVAFVISSILAVPQILAAFFLARVFV
jgi:hypothetical protein